MTNLKQMIVIDQVTICIQKYNKLKPQKKKKQEDTVHII